jgi:GNAT superfamily N-acetyltransferase
MVLSRIATFLSEFDAATKPHRNVRGRLFSGTVRIELVRINSEEYRIGWIYVQPKQRKKGHADQAISWLCELADAHNIRLALHPLGHPDDEAMNTHQLTAWYQKYGFVRIGMQDEMMRYPNATSI